MLVTSGTARCPICGTEHRACRAPGAVDVTPLDPLNPTTEVDHMPELAYYTVTQGRGAHPTTMRLNNADVKRMRDAGATIEPQAGTTPAVAAAKGAPKAPANKAAAPAANKGAGTPAPAPAE